MIVKKISRHYCAPLCYALIWLCGVAPAGSALAGEPRLLSTYGKWGAYMYYEGNSRVCFMASKANQPLHTDEELEKKPAKGPASLDMDPNRRGDPYAIVTLRPADHQSDVFSYMAGYKYQPDSKVTMNIGGQSFDLRPKGDTAWSPDARTDSQIAQALIAGDSMTINGVSARGLKTQDHVFLQGARDAYKKIQSECSR